MKSSTRKTSVQLAICLALLITVGSAFAGHHEAARKDIVDTAVGAGAFKTLVAAIQAAGLVDALKGAGPFTVFAPTDEAFAQLPAGTLDDLLKPENVDQLKAILTYHVVSGRVSARKAAGIDQAATLNGQKIEIDIEDGRLRINQANVVSNDIDCRNGVIHVIDRVLLPEATVQTSAMSPRDLIKLAVSRGAPLYNQGQAKACAAIYEVTAQSLLNGFAEELSETSRARLRSALSNAGSSHRQSASDRAWTLRHALDDVYSSLDHGSGARTMASR